jgi:Ca2+-transporting ATPase
VKATGAETQIGKIGRALQNVVSEKTPLQKETPILMQKLATLGLSLCALVFNIDGMTRGDWLQGF